MITHTLFHLPKGKALQYILKKNIYCIPKLPPSVSIQEMAMRKVTRTQFDEDDEDMVRIE